jgi:hypothetical protein
VARLLFILLAVLVVSAGMSAGCTSGAPSEEEAERTILSYLRNSAATITEGTSRDVEAVEVIEIGESYQQGRQTMWPVRVKLVSPKQVQQAEYLVFKDAFGSLRVLRRSAALPSSPRIEERSLLASQP